MLIWSGVEWTYDNLNGIGYDSERMLYPYETWYYERQATMKESESFAFEDWESKVVEKKVKDLGIKVRDFYEKSVDKIVSESFITISDSYSRIVDKLCNEEIIVSEVPLRYIDKRVVESKFFLFDNDEKQGDTVLFDFEAGDYGDFDFDDWVANNCPVNYEEVRPFIPGEYEYQDAYVGFRLTIPPLNGRFSVVDSTVYVDVEDTVEKGKSEVKAGELTEIKFSKRFYTSPQIMASILYAEEAAIADVREISKESFKVGLKSLASGEYVNGEINWLADGYQIRITTLIDNEQLYDLVDFIIFLE